MSLHENIVITKQEEQQKQEEQEHQKCTICWNKMKSSYTTSCNPHLQQTLEEQLMQDYKPLFHLLRCTQVFLYIS